MRLPRFVTGTTMIWAMASLTACVVNGNDSGAEGATTTYSLALVVAPLGTTSLFVEVFDAETLKPIERALVRVIERADYTDSRGRVFLDNLVPGETIVRIHAPGYVRVAMNTRFDRIHAAAKVYLKKRGPAETKNASEAISIASPDGIEVDIPANALLNPLGRGVVGDVDVYVTRFDPTMDLQWVPGPPSIIDTKTGTPLPVQVANLVAIEVEQRRPTGEVVPLSLMQDKPMRVTMPVAAITLVDVALPGFAQDKLTGRWGRSTAAETMVAGNGPGEFRWSANVSHLGMLAPGLAVHDPRKIVVRLDRESIPSAISGISVRAVSARSVATSFTGADGTTTLFVPSTAETKVEIPALDGYGGNVDLVKPDEDTFVFQVASTSCSRAGQFQQPKCMMRRYCDGFVWGASAMRAQMTYELSNGYDDDCDNGVDEEAIDVGWRCDTGKFGVCALGVIEQAGGCKEIVLPSNEERCNGLDDNCNGNVDENSVDVGAACFADPVTQLPGTTECTQFGAIVCKPIVTGPEIFGDGIDNDYDRLIDEGFCKPDDVRFCAYGGPPENAGVGTCTLAVTTCQADGQWGSCVGEGLPEQEILGNGLDDDCDAQIDEACDAGSMQSCYTGPDGTSGVGECKAGTQDCAPGGQWGSCIDDVLPAAEICNNGLDDDCNNIVDDPAQCTPPCNPAFSCCTKEVEVCDGVDNDLDGLVDALDPDLKDSAGNPATCCKSNGGIEGNTPDGIDNDCDGMIDEYVPGGNCLNPNANEVPNNGMDDDCDGLTDENSACPFAPEVCDGLDNDCDGKIDDADGLCCVAMSPDDEEDCDGDPATSCWDPPLTSSDATIQFSGSCHTKFKSASGANQWPGVRFDSLGKTSGKWYWEVPLGKELYNNYAGYLCIGIGTQNTPLVLEPVNLSNGTAGGCFVPFMRYFYQPGNYTPLNLDGWNNQAIPGAIVSVLLDLDCSTLRYWVNGEDMGQAPFSFTPGETYSPHTWLHGFISNSYGLSVAMNFGPKFVYQAPPGYQALRP